MLNFVCLKWGTKYSADYVNKLYAMVARHYTQNFQFYCITDDDTGINPSIKTRPLLDESLTGWWHKLSLFKEKVHDIKGEILFLDLDIIIVNNINWLAEYSGDFCIIKDWGKWGTYNSSVFRFSMGKYTYVWDKFVKNQKMCLTIPARITGIYGDQDWLTLQIKQATLWPQDKIVSFKKSCHAKGKSLFLFGKKLGLTTALYQKAILPEQASIIIFHGKPDPEDVQNHYYKYWKHAPWIEEHWRE